MHTVIKALLAASVAAGGASTLARHDSDAAARDVCNAALSRVTDAGAARIVDLAAAPMRPNVHRGRIEVDGDGPNERGEVICRIADGQADILLLADTR